MSFQEVNGMCAHTSSSVLRFVRVPLQSRIALFLVVVAWPGFLATPAAGAEPADFLVDQLSLTQFRQRMMDLSHIPAFDGAETFSRHWSMPGNLVAVDYIKTTLESYGYTNVVLDPYTFNGQTRHNIYATKVGTLFPDQMYIVSGHMDSFSTIDVADAPGFDDDGSGTALVMELARVFAKARVDTSIRFALWNNEETGLNGSSAYRNTHRDLQGTLTEPTWLGVLQHDMILFDRFPVADADVEFQQSAVFAAEGEILANFVADAMARYGTIPAEVTDNMNNTDSRPFQDDVASISIRENRRVAEIGTGSNPHWHKPTDNWTTYTRDDLEFGFNIVKMTAGALAELVNAEADCNMNNIADAIDIVDGAADVNGDGILDECQDCNGNTTLDPIEVADLTALDCNGNGVPDECDIAADNSNDCNVDAIPDECQSDCQLNFVPDDCDLTSGFSNDCDGNDVPDECENLAPNAPRASGFAVANRYLSFAPASPGQQTAVRVVLVDLPPPHDVLNGSVMWVGAPTVLCENSGQVLPPPEGCGAAPGTSSRTFLGATLQCTPFYMDWHGVCDTGFCVGGGKPGESCAVDGDCQGIIHVSHQAIVPEGAYEIRSINQACDIATLGHFTSELSLVNSAWGDTVLNCSPDPELGCVPQICGPPNGTVDIVADTISILRKFQNLDCAPIKARVDLEPEVPDRKVGILEVLLDLGAFANDPYPFGPAVACPL
jgi:hypothetical protein